MFFCFETYFVKYATAQQLDYLSVVCSQKGKYYESQPFMAAFFDGSK